MTNRTRLHASIVVPTYRRPDLLERCLSALLQQDIEPASYEIIVADDAADETTCRQVMQLAARKRSGPAIHYIPVRDTHGPAGARNAGWRQARGAIIAFTDDDCVPDPDWLAAGVHACRQGADGVSGRLVMTVPDPPTDYEKNAAHLQDAFFVTANCFYRRDVLEDLGGFDERFTAAWREDADLRFRATKAGFTMVRCVRAVVVHPVRPAPWGVSLSQQKKSMFNALLYKKHPTLYREHIQMGPPWRYYLTVASLITAAGGLAAGKRKTTSAGLLLWSLLSGRFAARRLDGTSHAPGHVAEMIVTSALIPPISIFWRLYGSVKFRVFFL